MKTKLTLFFLATLSLIFVSCGNKPEQVVEKYYTHLSKADFNEAKKYVTKEHQTLCDLLMNFTSEEERAKKAKTKVSVKNIKCEITDDTTAICTCQIKTSLDGEEKTVDEKVKLKKVDKNWYIDQGKESFGSEDDAINDTPTPTSEEDIMNEEVVEIQNKTTDIE